MTKEEAVDLIRKTVNDWGTITVDLAGDVVADQEYGDEPSTYDCDPDVGETVIVYRVEFVPIRQVQKSVSTQEFQ